MPRRLVSYQTQKLGKARLSLIWGIRAPTGGKAIISTLLRFGVEAHCHLRKRKALIHPRTCPFHSITSSGFERGAFLWIRSSTNQAAIPVMQTKKIAPAYFANCKPIGPRGCCVVAALELSRGVSSDTWAGGTEEAPGTNGGRADFLERFQR